MHRWILTLYHYHLLLQLAEQKKWIGAGVGIYFHHFCTSIASMNNSTQQFDSIGKSAKLNKEQNEKNENETTDQTRSPGIREPNHKITNRTNIHLTTLAQSLALGLIQIGCILWVMKNKDSIVNEHCHHHHHHRHQQQQQPPHNDCHHH